MGFELLLFISIFVFPKKIKGKGGHSRDSFQTLNSQNSIFMLVSEISNFKNLIFSFKKLQSL